MTPDPKLLDRIRKLLALGASSNPNEAASAIAHAQRLMAEHGLSAQDLDAAEIEGHGVDDPKMSRRPTPPAYETMLANVVKHAFGVEPIRTLGERCRLKFVGPGPRAQVAAYCYVVLLRQLVQARLEYLGNQFCVGNTRTLHAKGEHFAEGWVTAVATLIETVFLTPKEARAVATWFERNYPSTIVRSGRDARFTRGGESAVAAGYEAGSRAQLHRSMSGGDPMRQIAR